MKYLQAALAYILVLLIIGVFALISVPYNEASGIKKEQGTIMVIYPQEKFNKIKDQLRTETQKNIFVYNKKNIIKLNSYAIKGHIIINIGLNDSLNHIYKTSVKKPIRLE